MKNSQNFPNEAISSLITRIALIYVRSYSSDWLYNSMIDISTLYTSFNYSSTLQLRFQSCHVNGLKMCRRSKIPVIRIHTIQGCNKEKLDVLGFFESYWLNYFLFFLGISPTKEGLFQIDDVFFTAKEIQQNFGIGLGGKNGQPDESKRWPKSTSASKYHCLLLNIK